jgi:GAF domain-containing protein
VEGAEHLVLAHPIVQAELKRQVDDLELLSASSEQASAVLERARTLAKVRDAV